MPTLDHARSWAAAWCDAWNRRDLDAVMRHYAEDVAFCSPEVAARWGQADGWLHGRARLRAYVAHALEVPGLRLELVDVLAGIGQLCVLVRREGGMLAAEFVEFDAAGLAARVVVCVDRLLVPMPLPAPVVLAAAPVGTRVIETIPAASATAFVSDTDIREVSVEADLMAEPEAVWALLTRPAQIARWLLPNNFAAVEGHRFTFQAPPTADWDGAIRCEVLEVERPMRLSYRWGIRGPAIEQDTIVTWVLSSAGEGTRLRLVHAGYHSAANDPAYAAMYPDWHEMFARIERLAQ